MGSLLSIHYVIWLDLFFYPQQQNQISRIPMWAWGVIALIVIIIGVIWTLYEESEFDSKQKKVQVTTAPEPAESTEAPEVVSEQAESTSDVVEDTPATEAEARPASGTEATPLESIEPSKPPSKVKPDNLKRVKGIGPKTEKLLKDNGITIFAQLADTEVSRLQALLDEVQYTLPDPATWPEQAQLLAEEQA